MNAPFFQFQSLKSKVTLFTLVIFLTGIWTLAYFANRMLRDDLQHLLGEQQLATASIVADELNQEIDFRLRALETIAEGITPTILGSPTELQALLEERPLLQKLFNGGCFVTSADGTAIASLPLDAHRSGINFMERDHIEAALKKGKTTVSRPVIGKMLHAPVVSMAAPIHDHRGVVIAALAGVIDLSKPNFLDKITNNRNGTSGSFLLVAPQYRLIVTASDISRMMEELPAPGVIPTIDRFIQGYEGVARFVNPKGVEVLASVKRVPIAGWYVATVLPVKDIFAPVRAMQQRMLFTAVLLTLLAGGLTWWMLKHHLAPMLDAVKTLSTLSDSDQPLTPLPIARQDEVGQLIGGFNRLLETLALREKDLRESDERHSSILQRNLAV